MARLLFLAILSISSYALSENGSHLGFYLPTSTMIPTNIKQASRSIFRVIVPNFEGQSLAQFEVPSAAYTAFKNRFYSYKNIEITAKKTIAAQIQFCDQKIISPCQIFLNTSSATGFMMNGVFWTNAHVVEPYFNEFELQKNKTSLLIFIFNQNDELVFNPLVDRISIYKLPNLNERAQQRNSFYSEETDFIGFKLAKNLAPSLRAASEENLQQDLNQNLYITGFAACTSCHESSDPSDSNDSLDRSPFPNSTGRGMQVTFGPSLNLSSAALKLGVPLPSLARLAGQGVMFIHADSRQGMSGSPILNINGEVVGIFSGGKTMLKKGHLSRVSRGVRVQQLLH